MHLAFAIHQTWQIQHTIHHSKHTLIWPIPMATMDIPFNILKKKHAVHNVFFSILLEWRYRMMS